VQCKQQANPLLSQLYSTFDKREGQKYAANIMKPTQAAPLLEPSSVIFVKIFEIYLMRQSL
jgi:hypothetical protein